MARAELTESVFQPQGSILTYVAGASVVVNVRGGGTATIYQAPTGAATYPQPLTTAYGRIEPVGVPGGECWLDPGSYDVVVTFGSQTWTQRLEIVSGASIAVISESPVNAKDPRFGAVGDGAADDYLALKAFHDHVATATRGGEGVVPAGYYKVSNTPFQVATDSQKGYTIRGEGEGGTPTASRTTLIERTSAVPILSAAGSGVSDGQQVAGLALKDMSLRGNGLTGALLSMRRCSDVNIENIRLTSSADYGLFATQAWNWRIRNLIVNTCGDQASNKEAVRFADEGVGASNTNTVLISQSTFEANLWHDINCDGSVASDAAAGVQITNSKFERSVGYAVVWSRASICSITNCFMHSNGANGVLKAVNTSSCVMAANNVDLDDAGTAGEAVRLEGGNETVIANNTFWTHVVAGTPRAINIVASGITAVTIIGNAYQGTWTAYVTDNRATPRGIYERRGHLQAFDGISTKSKAGVISDADFLKTPPNGTIVVDELNNKIGARVAGTWKWATLT